MRRSFRSFRSLLASSAMLIAPALAHAQQPGAAADDAGDTIIVTA